MSPVSVLLPCCFFKVKFSHQYMSAGTAIILLYFNSVLVRVLKVRRIVSRTYSVIFVARFIQHNYWQRR
jgi:hypothetical protein